MRTAEAGVSFNIREQELPVLYVYGSPTHIRQIFLNVYGNGIKYNKIGGSLNTSMDVMMPNMNGLAATQKIRAMERPDAKTIPIIAMTPMHLKRMRRNA